MKHAVKFLAVSILAAAATTANAAGSKWYLGVGAGQSKVNNWVSESDMMSVLDDTADAVGVYDLDGSVGTSSDDKDTGYKIFGGYQFNDNFALEASYIDLGEVSTSANAAGFFYTDSGNFNGSLKSGVTAETDAFTVDALLTLPIADFAQLFFKAGVYRAETDLKFSVSATVEGETIRDSETLNDTSSGVHYGVGANFNLTQNIALRAEWERLDGVEADDPESDIDLLSASLIYKF